MKIYIHNTEDLEKACQNKVGYLLIEGDSGGDIYLTCPLAKVRAEVSTIFLLMLDLEAISATGALSKIDTSGEIYSAGHDAWTSCGDYCVGDKEQNADFTDGLWLSPTFIELGLEAQVHDVLQGRSRRVSL